MVFIEFYDFGFNGEHLSRIVVVNVEEGLQNKDVYLEFQKPNGEKYVSKKIILVDGKCDYLLHKTLCDEVGYLKLQLVAKGEDFIQKSKVYEYYIATSINATDEVFDEGFEDVITGIEISKADDISYVNNQLQLMADGKSNVRGTIQMSKPNYM